MSLFTTFYKHLNRRERITFYLAAAGFIIGLAGLALSLFFIRTKAVPAEGGDYREGLAGQPAYVNPVVAKSAADKSLTRLLFANLLDLADNIDTADQGRTIKVHLKEGLTWTDGREITSDDVIFTIDRIKDPDSNSPLAPAWQGVNVERASKLEMTFRLPAPYAFFDDTLSALRPLPKHLYAEIPPANWKLSDYNIRPVGSGPFVFASRTVETDGFISSYRLRANPRAAAGKPFIESIDLLFYRNQEELLKAFNSGAVDGFFAADPSVLEGVKRTYHATRFSSPTYYSVFWNQSASTPLSSDSVRYALDLATDRSALLSASLGEAGNISTDPLSPAFFPPLEAASSTASPETLLDKDGWTARDTDNIRVKKGKKNNLRLEFTLTVPDVPFLSKAADRLAADWLKVGAKANIQKMPLESLLAGPIKNRTYEALLFGNTPTKSGDLYPFWHSSERLYPGLNLALYQNRAADKLIEGIRQEPNEAKRKESMDKLRRTIVADDPALFLFSPASIYASGKTLRGVEPVMIADAADRFEGVEHWFVKTRRIWK